MTVIAAIVAVYFLWPMYVFCMAMMRAYQSGSVTIFAWCLAFPMILTAIILDVALNFTAFAVLMWDFPRRGEWTFSQRLNRLIKDDGWRGKIALWLADNLLDPYDPDPKGHIKR